MSVSLGGKRRKEDCSVTVLLFPCVEGLEKGFFCDLCVNKVCLSIRVSLCPDFCFSSNAWITSSAGVVFPRESDPDDDGLVFRWWGGFYKSTLTVSKSRHK